MHLPEQTDFYDIDVHNDNMRMIDRILYEVQPKRLAVTFLSSATFRPADFGLAGATVDVYQVGGGGGGSASASASAGGGGGGFCRLIRGVLLDRLSYSIIVGAGGAPAQQGGATTTAWASAPGGSGAATQFGHGGAGGSGGGDHQSRGASRGESSGSNGGRGGGTENFQPVNPYDLIAYGSGGGGNGHAGGGDGGHPSTSSQDGEAGNLGGGGSGGSGTPALGGNGGRGGGGGGAGRAGLANAGRGGAGIVYIYAAPPRATPTAGSAAPAMHAGRIGATYAGDLTPTEIMECDKAVEAGCIEVGILQNGLCVDVAVFEDLKTAKSFLKEGVWPEADAVVKLKAGYGIGDRYDDKTWSKTEPEPSEQSEESP